MSGIDEEEEGWGVVVTGMIGVPRLGAVCDGWVVVRVLYRVGCGHFAKSMTFRIIRSSKCYDSNIVLLSQLPSMLWALVVASYHGLMAVAPFFELCSTRAEGCERANDAWAMATPTSSYVPQ